jgi:uncharacterized membrane protein YfcA
LILLAAIFVLTCLVTTVTGGTALVTVPAMMQLHIPVRTALATNMVTLTLMSIGGVIPFLRGREVDRERATRMVLLTLAGSVIGAMLVFVVPSEWLPKLIPFAMLFVLVFLVVKPKAGRPRPGPGYAAVFVLAIYGGFFSGGYVTLLIAACMFFFGYTMLTAIVMARVMNVASSLIATGIFAWHGAIDWKLAAITGTAAFAGGLGGGRLARFMPERLLRIVFATAVGVLAVQALWSRR